MTGTIINAIAVVIGGFFGLLLKKGIPPRIEHSIMQMQGLTVIIFGINGIMGAMVRVDLATGKLSDSGGLLLLISLVLGMFIGELMDIDGGLNRFGMKIENRLGSEGFAKGFISASLIFCVGAMAIIGSLNDGLKGDSSVLFLKSGLDFVCSVVLGSSLGIGVMFAAIPVFLYQGAIAVCSGFLSPFISQELLSSICMVGYAIVMCIGLNFLFDTKIKTANLLPALAIPIMYNLLTMWKTL